jgi:hypothetical protein
LIMFMGIIASMLLIVAQSSRYVSVIIENNLNGTIFANYIWTVFNILTMLCFIFYARTHYKK